MGLTLESCSKSKQDRNRIILDNKREFDRWARRLARRGFEYQDAYNELVISVLADFPPYGHNYGAIIGHRCKIKSYHMVRDRGAEKTGSKVDKIDYSDLDIPFDEEKSDVILLNNCRRIAESIGGRELDIFNRHYIGDEDIKDICASYGLSRAGLTASHNNLKNALREAMA